jgi:hypothetical protein
MKTLQDAAALSEVLERLERVEPDVRALWGRMSAHEMLCHLCDSFRLGLGERQASPATGPFPRTVVKWVALHVPVHWPKGVPTRPEMEQGRGGTAPTEFARDKSQLGAIIRRFSAPGRRFDAVSHPIFGRMRDSEWLRWGYLHADHHLRQFGA